MPAHFQVSSLIPCGRFVESAPQVDGTIVVTIRASIQRCVFYVVDLLGYPAAGAFAFGS